MPVPQHLTNQPVSSMMKSPVRSIAMDDTVETIERTMSGNALSWVPLVSKCSIERRAQNGG